MSVAVVNLFDIATTINATAVITSKAISQVISRGFCSILVVLAGTSPSIDITMTVAKTATDTFYSPVYGDGTAAGEITSSSITSSSWIQFEPIVAPYFKIVLTGSATNDTDTTAKAYLMFTEEIQVV